MLRQHWRRGSGWPTPLPLLYPTAIARWFGSIGPWSGWGDSNSRLPPSEGGCLPLTYILLGRIFDDLLRTSNRCRQLSSASVQRSHRTITHHVSENRRSSDRPGEGLTPRTYLASVTLFCHVARRLATSSSTPRRDFTRMHPSSEPVLSVHRRACE